MKASVTASGGLAAYQKRLVALSKGAWREPLYDRIGKRLHELVEKGWETRTDPYGQGWKPTQQPNPILEETAAMRGKVAHEVVSNGITLKVDDWKAAFHQYGTKRGIVPRRMLPSGELPEAWAEAIQEEADAFFDEWLAG